mgnify:CR=1
MLMVGFGFFAFFLPVFYHISTTRGTSFRGLMPKFIVLQFFTLIYKHNPIRRGKWHHGGSENRSRVTVVKSTNKQPAFFLGNHF